MDECPHPHPRPTARASDHAQLLRNLRLPGLSASVVSDDNLAVDAALKRVWPPQPGPSLPQPILFDCEHHLRLRAQDTLQVDNAHAPRGRWARRLDAATPLGARRPN